MRLDSITRWTLAEGEIDGKVVFIRFRRFPKAFPRAIYPERLHIFWKMSQPDENGLATAEEHERLSAFEDRLVDAVEHDDHSVLLVALTGGGEKEFLFQTADVPGFLARLTDMPQEAERYPITIQREHDPEWVYYDDVRNQAS